MVEIITNFSSDDVRTTTIKFSKKITDKKIVELLNIPFDLNNNGENKNTIPLIDGRKEKLELNNLINQI
jgi:hypothetical protein